MTERKIGGQAIAKLAGCSPYGNAFSVYDELVNGVREPFNERMGRGMREEPRIRAMFLEQSGAVLLPHPGIIASKSHDWATASVDDLCELDGRLGVIDYKSVNQWSAAKWGDLDRSDGVPEHIAVQLRWYHFVHDIDVAWIFAAFGADIEDENKKNIGFDVKWTRLYQLERDREIEGALVAIGEKFVREHLEPRIPPPPDPKPIKKTKTKAKTEASI